METPNRISADQFMRDYDAWREEKTGWIHNLVFCTKCSIRIAWLPADLSLHMEGFPECSGPGTVITMPIPYCPQCEKIPETTGCLHISGLS